MHYGIIYKNITGSSLAGQANGRTTSMYFVYILKSLKDGNLYVGLTSDISKRLGYHNNGRVRSTKGRRPFKMIYSERFPSRMEARQREKFLKSYQGAKEKLTIIENL